MFDSERLQELVGLADERGDEFEVHYFEDTEVIRFVIIEGLELVNEHLDEELDDWFRNDDEREARAYYYG